jgi:AAA15 family ATPase/GTPase
MEEPKKDWKINELEINNFKSIKKLNLKPGRVNVFIGKPNAGKSNLLEALAFLGMDIIFGNVISKQQIRYTDMASLFYDQNLDSPLSILASNRAFSLEHQDGQSSASFALSTFANPIEFNDYITGNFRTTNSASISIDNAVTIHSKIEFSNTLNNPILHYKYNIESDGKIVGGNSEKLVNSNIRKYHFKDIPLDQRIDTGFLKTNGENLWAIVRHNSALKEFSNEFFKEFSLDVLFDKRKNKFDIMRRNEDSYYLIDFSMTPDTFQRMLYYLAAIESNKNAVILFEEPESQSYPPYIQMLAERIVDDTDNQYFITTHSPFIVEKMLERAGNDDDGIKFFVTYFEDYQTKVHELTKEEIDRVITNGIDLFFNTKAFEK